MANTIPCPNPVCTHTFSLAELQSAAQLLCPKCGFRMAGKGQPPVKPASAPRAKADATLPANLLYAKPTVAAAIPVSPAKPPVAQAVPAPAKVAMATPVAAPPVPPPMFATAVAAAPPPAATPVSGEESIPEGSFFNPGIASPTGPLLRSGLPRRKKGFNWKKLLVVMLVVGFAASVVIVAFVSIFLFMMGGGEGIRGGAAPLEGSVYNGNVRNSKGELEKAYKLVLNKNDWSVDSEIASRFGAMTAWKSKDQDFWFAIVAKDHDMFKPRDAVMLREGIDKLEGHFGDALELAAKAEPAKIGDLPAQKLTFKGQIKAATWIGDCYMFFKDGIAFWLFMASPDPNVVERFSAELPEKNFFVVTDRRGWREQPQPTETFASISGKLTMTAPKGVWEKHEAKNEDERGDLLLFGKYKREKDNTKNSIVLIFTLDRQKDLQEAMKAARDYLTKNRTGGDNNTNKILHASDVAEGQPEAGILGDVGNRRGRLIDLKLQFNDEPKRYFLLAVINEPDMAYAIQCECTWESRQIWRQEFLDLLGTLKVRKGE